MCALAHQILLQTGRYISFLTTGGLTLTDELHAVILRLEAVHVVPLALLALGHLDAVLLLLGGPVGLVDGLLGVEVPLHFAEVSPF